MTDLNDRKKPEELFLRGMGSEWMADICDKKKYIKKQTSQESAYEVPTLSPVQ